MDSVERFDLAVCFLYFLGNNLMDLFLSIKSTESTILVVLSISPAMMTIFKLHH